MAYREHINKNGAFELTMKGTLIKCFDEMAAGTVDPQTAPTELTDSTAGTPGATLAAVVGTTYSTDIPAIRNWIASLNARINTLQDKLVSAGVLTE